MVGWRELGLSGFVCDGGELRIVLAFLEGRSVGILGILVRQGLEVEDGYSNLCFRRHFVTVSRV